ncbi:NAD(P)H-dependent FMN reductase [Evansella caseinilytica]|uniref:NAD(P)H-dependent FMN reductase n=1 Tax=Evansella caseinilytica TaxID=1503961 RepID=A0A1H3QGC3_9BACI|nr:NAD(P)H-dependent oxidoreductase [Evansella caseinilytica]SDZ12171.1 NAD(P)H-dependent FMN reductase [Evansella caseinilytica]
MQKTSSIVLINGSMRTESYTKKLLEKIAVKLQAGGARTSLIDVRALQLPVYDPGMETPEAIVKVSEVLVNADGIIAGAPEYHGSYSGAIKNLLDYLGSKEFVNTPIGLVTTTGGLKAGTNTLNHLRLVFRNLHGLVIPQQFAISQKETTSDLQLDEEMNNRLENFIQGFETEVRKKLIFEAWERETRTEPTNK